MKKNFDVSVKQLYLLVFITAASLLGLGLYGINDLKKMNGNTQTLYSDRMLCIQQLLRIRFEYGTNILPMAQNIKNHTITFSEAKKRILSAQAIIDTNWRNYKLTYQTPEEKLLVRQTELLKNRADEATQNLLYILSKEDTAAVNGLIQKVTTAKTASFTLKINQLIDLQVRVAKEILIDSNKLYLVTSRNFFLLILLSLIIVIPISFYIIKNIKHLIGEIVTSRDIIKESEIKYRSILENASDAIYLVDNEGRFIEVNSSICTMTGYSQDELVQLKVEDIYDNEQLKTDPVNLSLIPYKSIFKQRRFIRKDGAILDVEIHGKRLDEDTLMGVARDVTERKRIETELREAEMKFRTMAEKSMLGVYINQNKRFLYVNPRFAAIFGYTCQELMDLPNGVIDTLYAEESRAMVREKIRARDSGETEGAHYEAVGLKKDGARIHVEFYGNRVTINGQPAAIGTMLDITERKNVVEQLKHLNENLQKQARELKISNSELEQFAYVASHDLQEPLRMITSFLDRLELKYAGLLDEKGKQYIRFATDGAKRMRQLILDLLDFSRAGRTDIEIEKIDVAGLLDEVLELYKGGIAELNARISYGNMPVLHSYKTPLTQVFQNLISNALKYHRDGVSPVIEISCKESPVELEFSVKDNGIGIDSEYFDKIFIVFQRLHNKDEYSGTGMGLALTKKIIENMGGRIWVESEEGKGSTFYFTIPKENRFAG